MQGILFKQDMIKAIVELRKTVTRRAIKLPHTCDSVRNGVNTWVAYEALGIYQEYIKPRYRVGETVYIKEAHYAYGYWVFSHGWIFFRDDEMAIQFADLEWQHAFTKPSTQEGWYKRSPLFLPEQFARYFLKITDVRAERLQEITPLEAVKEGFPCYLEYNDKWECIKTIAPVDRFRDKWDSINGKGDFALNKWVFRYEFEVVIK